MISNHLVPACHFEHAPLAVFAGSLDATRAVTLTRSDAAGDFGGDEHTPRHALTIALGRFLYVRKIFLRL